MQLQTQILRFVRENLLRGEQEVGPEDSLIELGIIDSIGLMQLMAFLEETTGIRIPDPYINPENFQSVTAMEAMMSELRKDV